MERLRGQLPRFFPIVIAFVFLAGCGGGGGSSSEGETTTFPAKILNWSPPSQYTDGSNLNPETDLDSFEIYINEDGLFSDNDNEMAAVSAKDPGSGQVNTSFNLANLAPFLTQGVTYHVSVRAVAITGLKSEFSSSAAFSF